MLTTSVCYSNKEAFISCYTFNFKAGKLLELCYKMLVLIIICTKKVVTFFSSDHAGHQPSPTVAIPQVMQG